MSKLSLSKYAKTATPGMLASKGIWKPIKPTKEHNERLKVEETCCLQRMYTEGGWQQYSMEWATKSGLLKMESDV